jgi:hypothetical protein
LFVFFRSLSVSRDRFVTQILFRDSFFFFFVRKKRDAIFYQKIYAVNWQVIGRKSHSQFSFTDKQFFSFLELFEIINKFSRFFTFYKKKDARVLMKKILLDHFSFHGYFLCVWTRSEHNVEFWAPKFALNQIKKSLSLVRLTQKCRSLKKEKKITFLDILKKNMRKTKSLTRQHQCEKLSDDISLT